MTWRSFEDGASLSQIGSEEGVILADEEHEAGARITLERDCTTSPVAITMGVYGWMMHTMFFRDEATGRREYDAMKPGLAAIASECETRSQSETIKAIGSFVDRFP